MIKKTILAQAIACAAITASSIATATASTTVYNTFYENASYTPTNAGNTDGWTYASGGEDPNLGWTSSLSPFGTTASVVNWAAEITTAGDSLTISSQDAHDRYGIWADIDTAKGGWFDGSNGWGHNTDVGLFKSDVAANVTINLTALQPIGSSETWTNFGVSVFTGMAAAENGWHHHGTWNATSFEADDPLNSGEALSYLKHEANVDSLNNISFYAEQGQVYSILLGGNSGGSVYTPHAGYSMSIVTSPVPLPAAVWLFGSAIAGLGFSSRRKLSA